MGKNGVQKAGADKESVARELTQVEWQDARSNRQSVLEGCSQKEESCGHGGNLVQAVSSNYRRSLRWIGRTSRLRPRRRLRRRQWHFVGRGVHACFS